MYAKKSSVLTYANKSVVSVHIAGFMLNVMSFCYLSR